jgi:class 3 adenylate cyclase
MSPTPIHTLIMKAPEIRKWSRRSPAVLVLALIFAMLLPTNAEGAWLWIRLANLATAVICVCSLMQSLEQSWHSRFARGHLSQRLLTHLALPLGAVVFGVAGVYLVGIPLRTIGDGGTTLTTIFAASLWLISSSAGSLLVMALDRIIRPWSQEFRSRLNTALLTLGAMMAFISYWTATIAYEALHVTGGSLPIVFRLNMGFGTVWNMDPDQIQAMTGSSELLATIYFACIVALATPAMMSASGKLADTLMSDLDPLQAGFEAISRGELDFRIPEQGTPDFARLNRTFNQMVRSLHLAKRMESAFGAYVSEEILDQIKNQHGEAHLEPTLRIATVFFADIRGFTTLSERINPKQLLSFLNRFYEEVARVVQRHSGFLVQYIGDAVIVVFNGPIDQPNHADMAASCAIDIQHAVDRLNRQNQFPEAGDLKIGIGIASGPLVAGNLGDSEHLLQYTVLGDTVNQAARLTSLTPPGAVYTNQRNAEMIDPRHGPIPLEAVKVKGKARKVRPHQIWPKVDATSDVTDVRPRPTAKWPVGEA